jgi:hypothetical protein
MSQQIIHNTGTNYTLYYNVINYFKTIMSNHPSILAVTLGDIAEFDDKQFPEYPVGNIQILESDFGTSVTNFRCQLMVADKVKNKDNESNPTNNEQTIPYYQVNDKVDIFANTLAILNDLTSYTQRGVQNFEINEDIICTPFADRFNNGLAGWVAEFTLTTHNDKNRCLFFLVNPSGSGYIIENCETQQKYKAVLAEPGSIGQVFATKNAVPPNGPNINTYYNFVCYTIVDTFTGEDDYNFVNLPILQIPYADFGNCEYCKLWTTPQVWSTTPQNWNSGSAAAYRQWQYD